MGLDLVEYVLAVEEAFGLDLPDGDMLRIETPRQFTDYLAGRLGARRGGACLSQRAFYRFRGSLEARAGVARGGVRPATALHPLLPDGRREEQWRAVCEDLGLARALPLRSPTRWRAALGVAPTTAGAVACELVSHYPRLLKPEGEPWGRAEVAEVLARLLELELGVDTSRHGPDSRYVRDMGLD